ncbi:MAG: lycopene cyclase domain-containing protein [Microbacteriaceae bacterium]|nr:MAG: lycopene cyclase domain-containing protein [Microbacteriaceae bacterium]
MPAYPIIALALVVSAVSVRLILGAVARRRGRPLPVMPTLVTGLVLVVLTLVFDNLMIGVGLYGYPAEQLLGVRIGLVPLEDLSYPIATAALLPAVWHLAGGDRD